MQLLLFPNYLKNFQIFVNKKKIEWKTTENKIVKITGDGFLHRKLKLNFKFFKN